MRARAGCERDLQQAGFCLVLFEMCSEVCNASWDDSASIPGSR